VIVADTKSNSGFSPRSNRSHSQAPPAQYIYICTTVQLSGSQKLLEEEDCQLGLITFASRQVCPRIQSYTMRHRLISFLSLSHIFLAFCQEPDGSLFANNTSPASFQELGPSVVAVEPSASIAKTAGPSGTLIQPKGGAIYKNHVGDVGNVEVIYRGVSDGTNDVGARTCTIDLHLVPVSRQSQTNSINLSNPAVIHVS
jgi:hypothetical protein